jgi:hypothetical protein
MSNHSPRIPAALSAVALGALAAASAVAQTVNQPPLIAGTPSPTGTEGTWYSFAPWARDPEGQPLTFRVQNAPSWAKVDLRAGRMNGWPKAGTYSNIIFSVSDGVSTRSLPPLTLVISSASSPSPSPNTLAQKYPGDVGIASDPAVIFHDPYEDTSSSTLANRYQTVQNASAIAMVSDRHSKTRGARSMRLTSGVSTDNAAVYRNFGTGYDEVYIRYYTKYVGTAYHHSGFWFGGYNPATNWPNPRAGQKPTGSDRFSLGLEPHSGNYMDFYTYWMHMRSWKDNPAPGDYFGNTFIHKNDFRTRQNAWTCYEIHMKLNPNPANGLDSVFEVWENDQLVRRFDNSGPYGWNIKDKFCPADSDSPNCTDFAPANRSQNKLNTQWRNTTALKINYIWPQNYNTTGVNSSVFFDDLVVAKSRVGCVR